MMTEHDLQIALWSAAETGDKQQIRILVVDGADVFAINPQGLNAIQIAAAQGHDGAHKTLLAAADMQRLMMAAVKKAA